MIRTYSSVLLLASKTAEWFGLFDISSLVAKNFFFTVVLMWTAGCQRRKVLITMTVDMITTR